LLFVFASWKQICRAFVGPRMGLGGGAAFPTWVRVTSSSCFGSLPFDLLCCSVLSSLSLEAGRGGAPGHWTCLLRFASFIVRERRRPCCGAVCPHGEASCPGAGRGRLLDSCRVSCREFKSECEIIAISFPSIIVQSFRLSGNSLWSIRFYLGLKSDNWVFF